MYFTIKTCFRVRDIYEIDIPLLQAERVRIEIKRTRDEYMNRIGFLSGPIIGKANMGWYEALMTFQAKLGKESMEIKKKMVHKGTEEEWCFTVHGV